MLSLVPILVQWIAGLCGIQSESAAWGPDSEQRMRRVGITGATGFVGRALVTRLASLGASEVVGLVQRQPEAPVPGIDYRLTGDLSLQPCLDVALNGLTVIVHTAARVHVMKESVDDPLTAFRRVNVEGTLNLALQAARAGVKRFVFVSSIGVNGAATIAKPFTADDNPAPHSPYALSKHEAEVELRKLAAATGMEVVIVRPPLVYGPGAPGNFGTLMRWLKRGIPLPLALVTANRRSLVALDNLTDFLLTCMEHPAAANQTFLVSDGEDLSTTQLLCRAAKALGHPARLLPVPVPLLRIATSILGRQDIFQRLCGSLQVDISKAGEVLAWNPVVSVDEGLRNVAEGS